jgi:hypothetical protein
VTIGFIPRREYTGDVDVLMADIYPIAASGQGWPRASLSFSADIHLNVLKYTYDHSCA